jgi:hypothetical protein
VIHDRYFPTPPSDFDEFRWRLQLLTEERMGRRLRESLREEEAVGALMAERLAR